MAPRRAPVRPVRSIRRGRRAPRGWTALALLALAGCGKDEPGDAGTRPAPGTPATDTPRDEAPPDPLGPPAPAPIGALTGLSTTSAVVYDEAPHLPHVLTVTFAFPERMRWWLALDGAPTASRLAEYRWGAHYYAVPPNSSESRELTGDDRAAALRRTELRRALLLWPEGFAWTGEAGRLTAALAEDRALATGEPSTASGQPPQPPRSLGTLVTQLDDAGRPARMAVHLPAAGDGAEPGPEQERLEVLGWRAVEGREFPDPLELHAGGQRIWREQLRSAKLGASTGPGLYRPVDRQELSGARASTPVEPAAVPAEWLRRIPLEPGSGKRLDDPQARAATWSWLDELATRHAADRARLELDREGRPVAALLGREAAPAADAPQRYAWSHREETPAVTRFLRADTVPDATQLRALFDRLPDGYHAGPPTARLAGEEDRRRLQLLLPLIED